jgi:hypothetical protein
MKTISTLRGLLSGAIVLMAMTLGVAAVNAENFVWAKRMGGSLTDNGAEVAVDANGNVYTTGAFMGTVDFDPGPGIYRLTTAGRSDVFVSKLNASGGFVWAVRMGSSSFDQATGVALGTDGSVHTTGTFRGTVDFDPGPGTFDITRDAGTPFISKLDNAGQFIWAQAPLTSGTVGHDVAVDAGGNVYSTGRNQSSRDTYILKQSSAGNVVWVKWLRGGEASGNGIVLDLSGNVYTTGNFYGTVDFNPGPGTYNLTSTGFFGDVFVSKLDSAGNFVWAKRMGGVQESAGAEVSLDGSGNVYTTGHFGGTVDFNPGAGTYNLTAAGDSDIFVSKLNSVGLFVWAKRIGGVDNDEGAAITLDENGNVFTTGHFRGTADFDPGAGTYNLTPGGITDIFVSKLNSNGLFIWAGRMGGADAQASGSGISVRSGNIHTTGSFSGTVDFNPGPGIFNLTSTLGSRDIFISKLSP